MWKYAVALVLVVSPVMGQSNPYVNNPSNQPVNSPPPPAPGAIADVWLNPNEPCHIALMVNGVPLWAGRCREK